MSTDTQADLANCIPTAWKGLLSAAAGTDAFTELDRFLQAERRSHEVFPPPKQVFAALERTPPDQVRVLVLGQDPYHGPGQAHGFSFSVPRGVKPPPSLVNIYKELEADLGVPRCQHGDLQSWAKQGVLLLNSVLTVRSGAAASHRGKGWELFTDEIIRVVNEQPGPVVFVLWGGFARQKLPLVDTNRHAVVEAAHPSPLSARRGFMGSRPFSAINQFLEQAGKTPIDWRLPA